MATLPAYFAQNPDVAAAYKENTYGLTPQEFADTHYRLYGGQEQRAAPPVVQAVTSGNLNSLPTYFQQNPDVAKDYLNNTYGLTPQQFAAEHYARYGQTEQRISPTGAPAVIPVTPVTKTVTPITKTTTGVIPLPGPGANTGASLPYFKLYPDVAASYLTNNYGMTPEQFAAAHYAKYGQFEQRSAPSTSPFASATSGFPQSFQNYTSIPIGAQYNPNVVGGTGSPYSQIMGQMRPAGPYNPYMSVASNTPMGGYDPGLYDRIAQANAVANLAAGTGVAPILDGGGDAAAAPGETGESVSGQYNKGGMVDGLFGMNPPGPDDGAGYLERGEYVIKKSAVNKYGKGLLDMINEGKVPAKKMKSLLG
jgi:hypothetical protein